MKALFIDDDDLNRLVMSLMLAGADISMDEAKNGAEGLQKIASTDYDFVLVDLRMPGVSGLDVILEVRARRDIKGRVPLIVVTADDAPQLLEECRAIGADALVQKPVLAQALFDAIGHVLASRPGSTV